MSSRSEVEQAVNLYFRGMNENDVGVIPLTEDVEISGPMIPQTICGHSAVRQYLSETAPFIARMDRRKTVIEGDTAAVIIEFEGLNDVVIEGAAFFQVKDGEIYRDKVYFDTRPLLKGSN